MRPERLSAPDAERAARRVAGTLAELGVTTGDRVAFALGSSASLLTAILGCLRVGVIPVLLNVSLLPAERAALVADAQPALVVDDTAGLDALQRGPERPVAPIPLGRPMHYTSGTSGRPKGVWSGVLAEDDAAALVAEEAELWGFRGDDVHLVCSPLYHSAAVRFSAGTLLAGGDVVVLPRFDARLAAAAIGAHRPTTSFMVPAHLQRLFALEERPPLGSFRLLAHAGSACPEPLKREALAAFPPGSVWEFYGSTEGQFTVCGPEEWQDRPGTVGRARPGRALRADGDGMLWCRVPPYARFAYWRAPEKTAAAWDGDAFTVGDLGRLDADGYVYLDGRRDDLIISGGVNVYPVEVERALETVAGVEEVAVFGAPDERWGQRVCAAVIGAADPDAVHRAAAARLAPYKRPKDVYLVADLPRTATGKVRRSAVAAQLGLAPG